MNNTAKNDMAKLIGIMNNPTNGTAIDPGVSAMKTILANFYKATDHLVVDSNRDHVLREAIQTEAISNGMIVGQWQIKSKTDSGRKLYDVVSLDEDTNIASDLTIFEAARGLASALSNGQPITSPFIRNVLKYEEEYAGAVHDAIHARNALKKLKLTESRRDIIEDKYSSAVRRAKMARSHIIELVENHSFI